MDNKWRNKTDNYLLIKVPLSISREVNIREIMVKKAGISMDRTVDDKFMFNTKYVEKFTPSVD